MCLHAFSFKRIFVCANCSLVKMIPYCLNPNLVLNLCAAVLHSMIALVANALYIKILLGCFLVYLLVHIFVFYDILPQILWDNLFYKFFIQPQYWIIISYCIYTISLTDQLYFRGNSRPKLRLIFGRCLNDLFFQKFVLSKVAWICYGSRGSSTQRWPFILFSFREKVPFYISVGRWNNPYIPQKF